MQERSGAEIARETGVGSGTLYPLLMRFEKVNWLASQWEQGEPALLGRPRKRLYKLTALGQTRASAAKRFRSRSGDWHGRKNNHPHSHSRTGGQPAL
ncbi:PadR family transcriptional regulator [Mesorhizobium sp. M00.F.Ca.ET.216.01.1.1]|nr:PadR family transcriptional regulator [Mesorhizobium sp. M00.F.Ca.ET.216.01.1.1]